MFDNFQILAILHSIYIEAAAGKNSRSYLAPIITSGENLHASYKAFQGYYWGFNVVQPEKLFQCGIFSKRLHLDA